MFCLPANCRSAVVQILSDVLPLFDTICKHAVMFARNCLNSSSKVVKCVANYMASILAGWLRDLDVMYFSVVNTSHWHWTTCLVKSLIHDACMIFVWTEEPSRHTVVICVCLSCSCLNMTFCLFRVAIFLSETLMQSFTVCVMIGVSTDIFSFLSVFICVLFYFFLFFSFLFVYRVYDFHNNNN